MFLSHVAVSQSSAVSTTYLARPSSSSFWTLVSFFLGVVVGGPWFSPSERSGLSNPRRVVAEKRMERRP